MLKIQLDPFQRPLAILAASALLVLAYLIDILCKRLRLPAVVLLIVSLPCRCGRSWRRRYRLVVVMNFDGFSPARMRQEGCVRSCSAHFFASASHPFAALFFTQAIAVMLSM